MPIEKFTHKEARKYDLPYPGQVFCRLQQDGKEEWGFINGVRPVYAERIVEGKKEWVLSGWTASLTTGFNDFRGLLQHNATYSNATDWHPAPDEYQMSPVVRALFKQHAEVIDILVVRVEKIEEWARDVAGRMLPEATPGIVVLDAATEERLNIAESKLVEANLEFQRLHERIAALTPDAKVPLGTPVPSQPNSAPVQGERPRRGASPA
jgi:hypothetical protein